MELIKKISNWGNGLGLRLDLKISKKLKLNAGDKVSYKIKDGALIIKPITEKEIITEEYLIAGLNESNCHSDLVAELNPEEFDF